VLRLTAVGVHADLRQVRHPNVAEQIKLDFRIMRAVGEFLDAIPGLGWLNLASSMEQFSHTIASQTRLDIEGTHLDLFNRNFRSLRASCGFPVAVLKSEAVLVESFEHGQLATRFIGPFARLRARRELERLEVASRPVRSARSAAPRSPRARAVPATC
jgi:hypothetical protein